MKFYILSISVCIFFTSYSITFAEIYTSLLPKEAISEYTIHHDNYSLGYDEDTEQAAWVMYEYTVAEANTKPVKRKDRFRADPSIPTRSANVHDYKRSGYDRGHLAPAADMAFNKYAMRDSFYFSNISPQNPQFNRGIWKKLETKVRKLAKKTPLIIVTAGVLEGDTYIGRNKVLVPTHFYKIIFATNRNQSIAFLMPNAPSKAPLASFAISIDQLEKRTGIDFFPALQDEYEDVLEAQLSPADWNF